MRWFSGCDGIESIVCQTVTLCVLSGKAEGETCADQSDCSDDMECVEHQTNFTLCSCAQGFLPKADRNCGMLLLV